MAVTSLWNNALTRLSQKVAPKTFELWIRPIECQTIEGNKILLRAPNDMARMWFEKNYLGVILEELRADDPRAFEVEIQVNEAVATITLPSSVPLDQVPPGGSSPAGSSPAPRAESVPTNVSEFSFDRTQVAASGLNTKYTFATFVAGPSNQLAHAAARAVASPDPPTYNPLFICGGVGLGKTHLLHAIGHEILRHRPGARILYVSSERFTNDYIHWGLRNDRMHEFRRRYREDCDVLLVDDIQFIANKESTQDEFFHTFNALYEQHRQIVLSADRKPHEIADIADRLRTRFQWGLMADIEPPELEVRVAILRKKADAEHIELADEVALYIASAVKSNVRELEGALTRLAAFGSLSGRDITLEYARETLEGSIARPTEHITVDHVLKAVATYYQVKTLDLKSERRHKSISAPRAVAMYLARKHTRDSFPDLGRAFGNKHHTTILSACDKIDKRLATDPALRSEIQAIENVLLR